MLFVGDGSAVSRPLDPRPDAARLGSLASEGPATSEGDERIIHRVFEAQARRTPDATALFWAGASWSYRDLDRQANRLAHRLLEDGVARGECVGLGLPRSPDLVVAMLGVLKAGAAYLPLDPASPPVRQIAMLRSADVQRVVHGVMWALDDAPSGVRGLVVDVESAGSAPRGASEPPLVEVGAEDRAYVMFTSGSTGEPKGVEVPHRAVVRLVRGQSFVPMDAAQTFMMLAPPAFDASTLEVWAPLLNGGRCAIYGEAMPDPTTLGRALREAGVTVLWLTSALFNHVVDHGVEALASLHHLLIGGEALSAHHVRRALEALPTTRILNGYGPTETRRSPRSIRFPATFRRKPPRSRSARPSPVPRCTSSMNRGRRCPPVGRRAPRRGRGLGAGLRGPARLDEEALRPA